MKKDTILFLVTLTLLFLNGCSSSCGQLEDEAICQMRLSQLDQQIEHERQKEHLTQNQWQQKIEYYQYYFGNNQESWRKMFLADLLRIEQQKLERQALIARLQDAYPETWKQRLWEHDEAKAEERRQSAAVTDRILSEYWEQQRIDKQRKEDRNFLRELQRQNHEFLKKQNQLNSGVVDISSPSAYDYEIGRW